MSEPITLRPYLDEPTLRPFARQASRLPATTVDAQIAHIYRAVQAAVQAHPPACALLEQYQTTRSAAELAHCVQVSQAPATATTKLLGFLAHLAPSDIRATLVSGWRTRYHPDFSPGELNSVLHHLLDCKLLQREGACFHLSPLLQEVVKAPFAQEPRYLKETLALLENLTNRHPETPEFWATYSSLQPHLERYLGEIPEGSPLIGHRDVISTLQARVGFCLCARSKFVEARALLERALQYLQPEKKEGTALLLVKLGDIAIAQHDIPSAQGHFEQVLQTCKETSDPSLLSHEAGTAFYGLGQIAATLCEFSKAEADLRKALKIFERLGSREGMVKVQQNLALLLPAQAMVAALEARR